VPQFEILPNLCPERPLASRFSSALLAIANVVGYGAGYPLLIHIGLSSAICRLSGKPGREMADM
jgi:hypothetical protein